VNHRLGDFGHVVAVILIGSRDALFLSDKSFRALFRQISLKSQQPVLWLFEKKENDSAISFIAKCAVLSGMLGQPN